MRPLPKTHPQFSVVDVGPAFREYCVENWRVTHNGEGSLLEGAGFTWFDAAVVCGLGYIHWTLVSTVCLPPKVVFLISFST